MEKIMSKKKSYMNKENILSEGFFDKIGRGLSKFLKVADDVKKAKSAKKDVEKAFKETDKSLRAFAKASGIDDYDKWVKELEKEFGYR